MAAVGGLLNPLNAPAGPREVTVPIRLDSAYLREVFVSQVFSGPGASARVWDDGSGCNYMVVSNPRISAGRGVINVLMDAEARVGQRIADHCIVVLDWSGEIETSQKVKLEPGGTALQFRVVNSRLQGDSAHRGLHLGIVWDWIKAYVHPRLAAVRIDLKPSLNDLRGVLRLVLPGRDASMEEALSSLTVRSAKVVDGGLEVSLGMEVPQELYAQPPPAPALTAAELARFKAAWEGWDGFVTFVVKHLAGASGDREVRRQLLDVLLEARYDILDILSRNTPVQGRDPVRALFMKTWSRLAPVLRRLNPEVPGDEGLRLLSFITAADALQALDALGPEFNLDISLDGLRRMARILAPDTEQDPLIYDQRVDPELRKLFDFGPPLPLPPDSGTSPIGWWHGLMPDAHASPFVDDALVKRLNHWVPPPDEIDAYLESVHRLLDDTGRRVATGSDLDPTLHGMFRVLVLATAWQETCWRQFTRVGGKIVPIRSPAGAVGMMQVVPEVWRGFYDAGGLTRDIGYNAAAGAQILMHYLVDYAIPAGGDREPDGPENLARATYAAYNGGPGQLRRYREDRADQAMRRIDGAFRSKFRKIRDGHELAVRSCFTQ